MKLKPEQTSFHAHHSPMGAYATLTFGMFGASGGLAAEAALPGEGGLSVGFIDSDGVINELPLLGIQEDDRSSYVDQIEEGAAKETHRLIPAAEIKRTYDWATDRFEAGNLKIEIINPFYSLPDPACSSYEDQRRASCPAGFIRLSFDNRSGSEDTTVFCGFPLKQRERWRLFESDGMVGGIHRDSMGFATCESAKPFVHWSIEDALRFPNEADPFLLGDTAGLLFDVAAGRTGEFLIAYGFYLGGNVTYGKPMKYWYSRYFQSVENVLGYALEHAEYYLDEAVARDRELHVAELSDAQKFLIAHATHSYYGSTQWFDDGGKPRWVVNEGEFRMMNTFDLTVDMLFYEMRFNPWTVRNVLEQFVAEYSYYDELFLPDHPGKMYPGGLTFTHDMGVANHFTPDGQSSYEVKGLDRECFSFMSCEQLTNWICCAGVYFAQTDDFQFLEKHRQVLLECFASLLNRDNPNPEKRNGIMAFESSKTWPGGEITTYDSLDHSLGQSRGNTYLAGKSWASYLALNHLFKQLGMADEADEAYVAAERCAATLVAAYDDQLGFIPAVLERGNESAIIPAIEGLIFPHEMGLEAMVSFNGPFSDYIYTLQKHLLNILKTGVCLYEDGGWKLSSTADNSWMSKIGLCQYVARQVLNISVDPRSDEAHMDWQVKGSAAYACSDQFVSGKARGSCYYPRIVTNILWLDEQCGTCGKANKVSEEQMR
ncbi:glycoside hydrolase family 52 protein [Pontiella sulfatireligans]|uniref:Beta-xylosidase n=1 Tax=Pontiella sulfatireligans TaxID=2750658 RepID=A0A6C2UGK7_9BACT|nr:glycoside hydrolase family 52 protein [Pontiella sulfatireligans]VGO18647.1 Beta-xylosidase [Pontiella sulfatireligans]